MPGLIVSNLSANQYRRFAEEAIETRKDRQEQIDADTTRAEGAVECNTALRQAQSNSQEVNHTVGTAVAAGEVMVTIGGAVKTAKDAGRDQKVKSGIDAAHDGARPLDEVKALPLTKDKTIGDVYDDRQLELLTQGKFTREELLDAGFDEAGADRLMQMAAKSEDGVLSPEQAADFVLGGPEVQTDRQRHQRMMQLVSLIGGQLTNFSGQVIKHEGYGLASGMEAFERSREEARSSRRAALARGDDLLRQLSTTMSADDRRRRQLGSGR